jgi:hypothetical protein
MKHTSPLENGQSIALIALALFAMMVMSVLVVDGGQTYLHRREAQAAADAGALAGANELCFGAGASNAPNVAIQYATTENEATSANAWVSNGEVFVDTTIAQTSFIAQMLGQPSANITASAAAACFSPGAASGLMPIAWACRPPVTGSISPSEDCEMKALDWVTQLEPMLTGTPSTVDVFGKTVYTPFDFDADYLDEIYVVMDSKSTIDDLDEVCKPDGYMECDLNGDGRIDIIGNGNKGWLDMNGGGGGASEIRNWIQDGYNNVLSPHTWLGGQPGTQASSFKALEDYQIGNVVLLPVFNAICSSDPLATQSCQDAAHATFPLSPDDTETVVYSAGAASYFHIVGFAQFFVSCVDAPGSGPCPGHDAVVDVGTLKKNDSTIEGYFVSDYPIDYDNVSTGGLDVGIRVVSLTR